MLQQVPSMLRSSLSRDGRRLQLKVLTPFRPSSPEALHFDQEVRQLLQKGSRDIVVGGKRFRIQGAHTSAMQITVDAAAGLARAMPKVLGIFLPLAAIAISFTFRSAFLSLKLGLTVIIPIITTYGLAVVVYQLNGLGFLGCDMLKAQGGIDFRMIVLTAGILFGFAMDYDLFLFVRVFEYRSEGFDNLSAVKRAVAETGPVITTAGTLMVCSFFCIMCSHTVFLRTMGFIFTVGVLFDVYIVRTMIAPVFLVMGENLNYWPGKMPVPMKRWDGETEIVNSAKKS